MEVPHSKSYAIIGGSSGIGLACAQRLLMDGHQVTVVARDPERLASVSGVQHICADVTLPQDRARLAAELPELDGLVYSAGGNSLKLVRFLKEDFVSSMTDVHLQAPLLLLTALLRGKRLRHGASIVWIGSIAANQGSAGNTVYTAVKTGLMASIKPLARELFPQGIRINAVAPGLVDTPMTQKIFAGLAEEARAAEQAKYPLGIPSPENVAKAVNFLLSPDSSQITGTILTIDGGASI